MPDKISIPFYSNALNNKYILILTSNATEKNELNKVLPVRAPACIRRDVLGCTLGMIENTFVLHVSGESGVSSERSVGRIAIEMLSRRDIPQPSLVLLVGFCWGNPTKTVQQQVIVSNVVYSFNKHRATPQGPVYNPKVFRSSLSVEDDFCAQLKNKLDKNDIDVLVGPLASMEVRLEDDEFRDCLIKEHPSILAGEMEAFGFLPSCEVPWLIVKAVSDLGGADYCLAPQSKAASRAAAALQPLLKTMTELSLLHLEEIDGPGKFLRDILTGDTVSLNVSDVAVDTLNDYLNDVCGPKLEYKLKRFCAVVEYGENFSTDFCDLLLELMQNAIKHGHATFASVQVVGSLIRYEDDGDTFAISEITGERGGARVFRRIAQKYLENGVGFEVKSKKNGIGNIYAFKLKKVDEAISEARSRCQVFVNERTIGGGFGRPQAISFEDTCGALYLDLTQVRMTSRRISIFQAVQPAVATGRKLYVACRSKSDVQLYTEELLELGVENVSVFVSG